MAKKFNNVENECIKLEDGREIWLSRSMAVMGVVIARHQDQNYVLVSKRGQGTPDFQGYYNLVCGYLDKNETLFEAIHREIWEETGLDVNKLRERLNENDEYSPNSIVDKYFDNNQQPITINDDPLSGNRQNVTTGFIFKFNVISLPELTNENSEKNEVEELQWMPLSREAVKQKQFAFNHDIRINQVITHFTNEENREFYDSSLYKRNIMLNKLGGGVRIDKTPKFNLSDIQ